MSIELKELKNYVSLTQGLAINEGSAHLVSSSKSDDFSLPLLRIADMMENKYEKYISKEVQRNVIATPSDIIYTRTGQIGLVFTGKYGVVHNNSFIVKIINDDLLPNYLIAILQSDFVRKQALSFAHNSVQPDLTHDMFKAIKIPIPSKPEQEKFANLYHCFMAKIDKNNAINNNLVQSATTLYDFKFAKNSPNGKLSKILIENPKSTIQVGDSEGVSGDYPFFTSGETINEWRNYLVDGINCFLSTGGNASIKAYYGKATYSTDTWCITGKGEYSAYLYFYLKSIIKSIGTSFFAGSGLKHLQKDALKDVDLYLPTIEELKDFNKIVYPILKKSSQLYIENKKLIKQRDFLLPLLMNGQATIEE